MNLWRMSQRLPKQKYVIRNLYMWIARSHPTPKADEEANKKRKVEAEKAKPQPIPMLKSGSSLTKVGPPKQPARPPFKSNFKPVSSMAASSSTARPVGGLPTKSSAAPSASALRPTAQPHNNPQAQIQAKMQATLDAQIAKEKAALKAQKVAPKAEPEPEEDEFELPDIASESVESPYCSRRSKLTALTILDTPTLTTKIDLVKSWQTGLNLANWRNIFTANRRKLILMNFSGRLENPIWKSCLARRTSSAFVLALLIGTMEMASPQLRPMTTPDEWVSNATNLSSFLVSYCLHICTVHMNMSSMHLL